MIYLRTNRKAFTLVELLIVIAIIGILAVAFGPSLFDGPAKARDAQRITDVRKIADFFSLRLVEGKSFPTYPYQQIKSTYTVSINMGEAGKIIRDNLDDFGGVFPTDPNSTKYYRMFNHAKYFTVVAQMESVKNGNVAGSWGYSVPSNNFPTYGDSGAYFAIAIPKK